jgi:hypothetical protein
MDSYRIFHPTTRQCLFFAYFGTFSKIDHNFRHKASLNKFQEIEIISYTLSDPNEIKLDLNNKRNHIKYSNTWRLNNMLLNDYGVTGEKIENENRAYKNLWDLAKVMLRGKFIAINTYITMDRMFFNIKRINTTKLQPTLY